MTTYTCPYCETVLDHWKEDIYLCTDCGYTFKCATLPKRRTAPTPDAPPCDACGGSGERDGATCEACFGAGINLR